MVGFPRSLSLPRNLCLKPAARQTPEKTTAACHVRSVSLPSRSHPLISHLEAEIRSLRAWEAASSSSSTRQSAERLAIGLDLLYHLHASLQDLLLLSTSQEFLRRPAVATWVDRLLDHSLRFADAFATLRSAVLDLAELRAAASAAARRNDEALISSCARSRRRAEKDLARLASAVRSVARSAPPPLLPPIGGFAAGGAGETEIAGMVREAVVVTASVSGAVISGIAAAASSSAVGASKRSAAAAAAGEDDDGGWWMGEVEKGSERVLRGLISVRVSLLNILTPCLW